jgi:cytidylate kinase
MKDHNSTEELNRLLEVRLKEWRLRESNPHRPKPVVTITREPGSGGESIAKELSAGLGFHLYDWELVEQIAKDEKISPRLVSTVDEHYRSEYQDWQAELEGEYDLSSRAYIATLKQVLLAIALPGNAVIVGRGSNFFFPPDGKIGLCFVAPLDLRIKNTMKELGLSEKAARKHISKVEAEHRKLAKKYFQADLRDSTHYHLVINTALVKPGTIVELVKSLIEAKKGQRSL